MLNFIKSKIKFIVLSIINFFVPKRNNYIFVHDKYLKKDNAWSLAKYIAGNELKEDYIIFYYTKNGWNITEENIIVIQSFFKSLWYQFRSVIIIYSYRGDDVPFYKSFRKQKIIDTMHGSPLKKIGYLSSDSPIARLWRYEKTFDYILCQSDFFKEIIMESFGCSTNQTLVLGLPRNDEISLVESKRIKNIINNKEYFKTILWLPTWRDSITSDGSKKSFPVINSRNIGELNKYLKELNIQIILKPHPYQLKLDLFKIKNSNIKIITNEDLIKEDVSLYDLFTSVDCLITDYSSVYFDFLLTYKQIAFTVDDIEDYTTKQGFNLENPMEIMPGFKINDYGDLKQFIINIYNDIDNYKEERERVLKITNKYLDNKSCERIVNFLNL